MESITLGQLAGAITLLVALVVGYKTLKGWTIAAIKSAVKEEFEGVAGDITRLETELKKEDKEKTKNFLVDALGEIENGESWTEIKRQRFYEQYDHYTKDLNGNTYIKTAVGVYEKDGKIWR